MSRREKVKLSDLLEEEEESTDASEYTSGRSSSVVSEPPSRKGGAAANSGVLRLEQIVGELASLKLRLEAAERQHVEDLSRLKEAEKKIENFEKLVPSFALMQGLAALASRVQNQEKNIQELRNNKNEVRASANQARVNSESSTAELNTRITAMNTRMTAQEDSIRQVQQQSASTQGALVRLSNSSQGIFTQSTRNTQRLDALNMGLRNVGKVQVGTRQQHLGFKSSNGNVVQQRPSGGRFAGLLQDLGNEVCPVYASAEIKTVLTDLADKMNLNLN